MKDANLLRNAATVILLDNNWRHWIPLDLSDEGSSFLRYRSHHHASGECLVFDLLMQSNAVKPPDLMEHVVRLLFSEENHSFGEDDELPNLNDGFDPAIHILINRRALQHLNYFHLRKELPLTEKCLDYVVRKRFVFMADWFITKYHCPTSKNLLNDYLTMYGLTTKIDMKMGRLLLAAKCRYDRRFLPMLEDAGLLE